VCDDGHRSHNFNRLISLLIVLYCMCISTANYDLFPSAVVGCQTHCKRRACAHHQSDDSIPFVHIRQKQTHITRHVGQTLSLNCRIVAPCSLQATTGDLLRLRQIGYPVKFANHLVGVLRIGVLLAAEVPAVIEVPLYNLAMEQVGTYPLPGEVFGQPVRLDILHRVVRWQRAKKQQVTASSALQTQNYILDIIIIIMVIIINTLPVRRLGVDPGYQAAKCLSSTPMNIT
jgi:hypothetical protein